MKKLILLIMFVSLIGVVSAINWNDNLIAYYDFEDGSGTTITESSSNPMGLDLTMVNMEASDWVTGKLGSYSVYFGNDGRVDNEQAETSTNIGVTGGQSRSVFCWANHSDTTTSMGIAGWGSSGNGHGSQLGIEPSQTQVVFKGVNSDVDSPSGETYPNDWMFVGFTLTGNSTGGEIRVYMNGTQVAVDNRTLDTPSEPLIIGNHSTSISWSMNGSIDECSIWNRTLSQTDIDDLWNSGTGLTYQGAGAGSVTVTLNSPSTGSQHSTSYIGFNATLTPTIANITNATLFIWNSSSDIINETTNVFTGYVANSTFWNVSNFSLSTSYHWNVYGCVDNSSDDAVCAWSISNYTFTSSAFSETYQLFNYTTLETRRERFSINISANDLISSASAELWYNGTAYTSTVTDGTAGVYKANNNIDIPLSYSQSSNKSFYWQWIMQLTTGETIRQNTTTYSHNVNRTYFIFCNTTHDIQYVNFTTHTSVNPYPHVNATFKISSNHWLGGGDVQRNYSFEDITETNHTFDFCFSEPNNTLNTDTTVEIDGTGYSQNYHYLVNASLTNTTNAIDLYLLNDTLATLTVLEVRDQAQNPLEDVYIQIQLYDVGTDTYYTVGMAKTSFNGEDIAYLNWYDTFYKFILTKDGSVLKTTTPYKVSETPQIFEIITETTFTYDKFEDFLYSLYYNDATENFVLTFTKPSGLVDSGCLRVIKRNPSNDSQICLVCETSSSATLYCNIAGYGNGTYIASFYATGSLKIIDTISEFIGTVDEIYNQIGNTDGSIYAFLFAGVVVALFFFSPVIAIIGLLLAIGGSIALGFQPVNYLEFIGIVILGGTVIWILQR